MKKQPPKKVAGKPVYKYSTEKELLHYLAQKSSQQPYIEKKMFETSRTKNPEMFQAINFLLLKGYLKKDDKEDLIPTDKALAIAKGRIHSRFIHLEEEGPAYDESKQYPSREGDSGLMPW